MAMVTNQPGQSWKQAAMQKAERLTDLWDVIKAWAGRAAEIVLSLCMFAQLIGVLPGVHYWPWVDNFILAVQIIMLDMGAFALHTLAEQARESGKEEAANKADRLATFLIRLMIATIALIIIGQVSVIFKDYASTIQAIVSYVEVVLILVRVVSTVKYIHTIHSLRGTSEGATLNPTQVASLEQVVHDRITALTEQSHHHLQGVQTEIIREVQTILQDIPALVQDQVNEQLQGVQTEMSQGVQAHVHMLVQTLPALVQDQVQNFLTDQVQSGHYAEHATAIQELAVSLQEVKREMRTTITEVRTVTRQGGAKGGAKEPLKLVRAPLVEADPAPQSAPNGQGANSSEGVQERVQKFITEQLAKGCKPTLGEIQEGCTVSKHTAIKYRRALLGDDESEEAINQ